MRNVVIIGSGCAGNTAAIYTARANLKPLVVSGHEAGGQLSLTTLVENFPGFPEGINGPDLVENMKKQAQNFGAEYLHAVGYRYRPFRAPVPPQHRRRVDRDPHRDHRLRRFGALAGAAIRTEADRPRRQLLRHLRRILLSRQEDHGGRRRRFGHGRGQLPDALRHARSRWCTAARSSARRRSCSTARGTIPRSSSCTNTVVEDVYDVVRETGHRRAPAQSRQTGEVWDAGSGRLLRRHRPHSEHAASSRARSIPIPTATSSRRAARAPISPAYFTPATCRTASTARPSPRPARAAWRRLKRNDFWKRKDTDT